MYGEKVTQDIWSYLNKVDTILVYYSVPPFYTITENNHIKFKNEITELLANIVE